MSSDRRPESQQLLPYQAAPALMAPSDSSTTLRLRTPSASQMTNTRIRNASSSGLQTTTVPGLATVASVP